MDRRTLLLGATTLPLWWTSRSLWAKPNEATSQMLVHTRVPHNAEPPLDKLVEQWITPTEHFYVRSHAPVPEIDTDSFRLQVEGLVNKPLSLSLEELKNAFPQVTVTATMTCAGNRRVEHSLVRQISGVPWQAGAIGNATWTGAKLSDLLRRAGVQPGAKHVWFEGLDDVDRPQGVIPFGASIPMSKAMSNEASMPAALVASGMNGKPLTPDHGFPLRTVIPGFIGARSVKWLGKIVVSDRPSPNHYVATAYKLVKEGTDDEWATSAPLEQFAMNSVTCIPAAEAEVRGSSLRVRGYALAAGSPGRTIASVELSSDGGKRWNAAKLDHQSSAYCWRLWSADVPISPATEHVTVRAIDSAGDMQPETVAWNLKGYMFNAWHKTPIKVH